MFSSGILGYQAYVALRHTGWQNTHRHRIIRKETLNCRKIYKQWREAGSACFSTPVSHWYFLAPWPEHAGHLPDVWICQALWSFYTWGPFFGVWSSFPYKWAHSPRFPSFYLHNLLSKTSLPRESVLWLFIETNPLMNFLYLILSWLFTALNRMCSTVAANLCFSFFNLCYLPARCSEDHPGKNPSCSIKNNFYYI